MAEHAHLLRGGVRDGQVTDVADGVTRLLTPSDAPGLLDVYELTQETAVPEGGTDPIPVFDLVGQEPAEGPGGGIAAELLHMPGSNPVPGST